MPVASLRSLLALFWQPLPSDLSWVAESASLARKQFLGGWLFCIVPLWAFARWTLWTPVTMSWSSSGPKFRVVWLWEMLASGRGSRWWLCSFVYWLVPYAFWDATELFCSGPELANSRESRQDKIARLKCGFLTYWTLGTTSMWLQPQFLWKFGWCSLLIIWELLSFVPSYTSDARNFYPCLVLQFLSSSSKFSAGKVKISDYYLIVSFWRETNWGFTVSKNQFSKST